MVRVAAGPLGGSGTPVNSISMWRFFRVDKVASGRAWFWIRRESGGICGMTSDVGILAKQPMMKLSTPVCDEWLRMSLLWQTFETGDKISNSRFPALPGLSVQQVQ